MTIDPDVHALVTTRISTSATDVTTYVASTGTTNLATIAGKVDTTILDLNNEPMPPKEDPPLEPPIEGRTHMEQPPGTTTGPSPWYYAKEIGPRIGKPHVDLGEDLELARLREVLCQVNQTEEPRDVGCNVFAE
uniref:Uncharacterized protein n=1 Tax=Cannabis sativa TaxID=3483 RepID=A0A803QHT1_CANSA